MTEYRMKVDESIAFAIDHKGQWSRIMSRDELIPASDNAKYLAFIFWHWPVPPEILSRVECIGFHCTDLPYGRGGSPIQNLIERGHTQTKLTAFRMTEEMDAGPIYMQHDLSLNGTLDEIRERIYWLAVTDMLPDIVKYGLEPEPQEGEVVAFKRRTPEQSKIDGIVTDIGIYDFIRMLDGEYCPPAFIPYQGWKLELRKVRIINGEVIAETRFKRCES